MTPTSTIEVSESALRNNLQFIKSIVGANCTISSVVKGNAYGHGLDTFVPLAYACGIGHFSVFSAQEAYKVHALTGPNTQIMIMGMMDKSDIQWAIENNISFFVFGPERMADALTVAKRLKKPARIHLELDTGMNRTGFDKPELMAAVETLGKNASHFIVEGICTHYAGAESFANHYRVQKQMKEFTKQCKWLSAQGFEALKKHTACSAAAVTYPRTQMDMVRIGIMQYGFWPSKETMVHYLSKKAIKTDPLIRAISWKSRVMSTHNVKEGEYIGYGNRYIADKNMRTAVVPVGYAMGYSRSLSDQGRILINGHRVGVLGMVNMNMLIADISHVPSAQVGDEVVLIGEQGDLSISVSSFSEMSDQLNYELLTRLPHDIPRTITP